MNKTQSSDKAGSSKESIATSAAPSNNPTTTNTATNANAPYLHPALSFAAHAAGSPLDPSMLLTPTAAAAVAAVAQQIAQAGAPHGMTLSSQSASGMQHLGLPNVQTDAGYTMSRPPSDAPPNDNNMSASLVGALTQPVVPSHLALLNASLSFGNSWPGMPNKGGGQVPSQQMQFSATPHVPQNTQSMIPSNFQVMQNNAANMVAAAAQVAAAQVAISSTPMADALVSNMKNWKLEQIEEHVKLLQQLNQPIPQSVSVLLADSRRKEEKRSAKRVANRKSACTSRARKKALVEEMTKTNAKLRRQALILALLPDLVIAMTTDGVITFCSAQVERVLQHNIDDLVGANLSDLLVPSSREAMRKLVHHLVQADQAASQGGEAERGAKRRHVDQDTNEARSLENENGNQSSGSGSGADLSSGAIAVVSDKSFPLTVVQVGSQEQTGVSNSDLSATNEKGGKPPSNFTESNTLTRSSTSSSIGGSQSGEDDRMRGTKRPGPSEQATSVVVGQQGSNRTSSDDSCSSSSAAKRLRQANANLERNVRWHKEKLFSKSNSVKSKSRFHKDDVTGASVTANNASARLSSLQHYPGSTELSSSPSSTSKANSKNPQRYESMEDQSSSEDSLLAGVEEKKKEGNKNVNESSDDSGYRESNGSLPSREDTSSSDNEFPNDGGRRKRRKPLAPTCTVCLIRNDLTTIWCEVTSSIRTRIVEDETAEVIPQPVISGKSTSSKSAQGSVGNKGSKGSDAGSTDDVVPVKEVKELLLCLRPIRDGEKKVDESLRLAPAKDRMIESGYDEIAEVCVDDDPVKVEPSASSKHRPPKKRFASYNSESSGGAQPSQGNSTPRPACASDAEKSVVESLILMSSEKN